MASGNQPIIVKKIKKGGHGHHGGAWKVAFADFMTAMMAFFMVMWLLASTTPEQKKAIKDYFNNPSMIPGTGGGTNSMISTGGEMEMVKTDGWLNPQMPSQQVDVNAESNADSKKAITQEEQQEELKEIAKKIEKKGLDSIVEDLKKQIESGQMLGKLKEQVRLDVTNDGLRIQIIDKENRPMFEAGKAVLKPYTRILLQEVAQTIAKSKNKISITGHTDRTPFYDDSGYTNWELSADRANAARRAMVLAGLPEWRMDRVIGQASVELFDKRDPFSPSNRRISIVVLNREAQEEMLKKEFPERVKPKSTPTPLATVSVTQPAPSGKISIPADEVLFGKIDF